MCTAKGSFSLLRRLLVAGTVFIVEQNTEGEGLNWPRLAGRITSGGEREEDGRRSRFSSRFTGCSIGSFR